jgi:hypothetical protein
MEPAKLVTCQFPKVIEAPAAEIDNAAVAFAARVFQSIYRFVRIVPDKKAKDDPNADNPPLDNAEAAVGVAVKIVATVEVEDP